MFSKSITRALSQSTKLSSVGYALPTPGAYAGVKDDFVSEIQALRDNGTIKTERIILGKQGSRIKVQNADGSVTEELNFCANNYLGLSSHPDLIEAQKRVCDTHGAGVSSVQNGGIWAKFELKKYRFWCHQYCTIFSHDSSAEPKTSTNNSRNKSPTSTAEKTPSSTHHASTPMRASLRFS